MNTPYSFVKLIKLNKKQLGKNFRSAQSSLLIIFSFSHILRHVIQPPPPRSLLIPISISTIESTDDDNIQTVSVVVSDGANQKPQKNSTIANLMPIVSSIRELISYVPTMKNMATRGHLTGIPYLGDKFDDEDQQLINSISGESTKQNKLIRSRIICFSIYDKFVFLLIRKETQ
jgi:hypothetical protein